MPGSPDFTGSGPEADATIELGFFRANSTPVGESSAAGTITAGIDNWRIVLDAACEGVAECDDDDPCTTDTCDGVCAHADVEGCGVGKLTFTLTDHEHHWGDDPLVVYQLDVGNAATDASASSIVVSELVPQHTTFVAASSSPSWACSPDGNAGSVCTASVGELEPSAGTQLSFAVHGEDGTDPGFDVFDAAVATMGGGESPTAPSALATLRSATPAGLGFGGLPRGGVLAGDVTPNGNAVSACLEHFDTCCAVILYSLSGAFQCYVDDDCYLHLSYLGDPCADVDCECGPANCQPPTVGECVFNRSCPAAETAVASPASVATGTGAAAAATPPATTFALDRYYQLRERVLAPDEAGRRLIALYYTYTPEIVASTIAHPELVPLGLTALAAWNDMIDALVTGGSANVTAEQTAALVAYLDALRAVASPTLHRVLDRERARLGIDSWTGIRESAVLSHFYDLGCERGLDYDSINCRLYQLPVEVTAVVTDADVSNRLNALADRSRKDLVKFKVLSEEGKRKPARAALRHSGKVLKAFLGKLKSRHVATEVRDELQLEASEIRADLKKLKSV